METNKNLGAEDWLTKNCDLKDWACLEERLNDFINTTDVCRYMEKYATDQVRRVEVEKSILKTVFDKYELALINIRSGTDNDHIFELAKNALDDLTPDILGMGITD
jgi:hypothetical protein